MTNPYFELLDKDHEHYKLCLLIGHAYQPHLLKLTSYVLWLRMLKLGIGEGRQVINYNLRNTAMHYFVCTVCAGSFREL